ncbi:hypothetical protein AK812_SmicGene43701, partial [Symbiodinium microadriaticum]
MESNGNMPDDAPGANVFEYLRVHSNCRSSLSGVYAFQGWTRLGRPWYKYENIIMHYAVYLWYDEHCGAAWYLKGTAPNDRSSNDLDGAEPCEFYSKLGEGFQIFLFGTLRICGSAARFWLADSVRRFSKPPLRVSGKYCDSGMVCLIRAWSCEILPESQCITTSSFPRRFYGSYEQCTIQVADNNTLPLQVLAFKTGSEDSFMVNGQSYSSTTGPVDVVPQGSIEWRAVAELHSDPPDLAQLWQKLLYCTVDDEGCIGNGDYLNSDNAVCGIFVDESNDRRLFWKRRPQLSTLLINGEEFYGNESMFATIGAGPVPEGFILRRAASSPDSFKICLEAKRKWEEKHGHLYDKWYRVKMRIIKQPTQLDLGRAYLFKAAGKLQVDMSATYLVGRSEAFESQKHPFYVDGKKVLDYTKINWASQISLKALGEEIKNKTADGCAVIIAACDVNDVGEAKFAFMPLFDELPKREGEGVKRCGWYSFYRFSVMAKMQIAVDEGATRLKLLGIQPDVGNAMTVQEYPALEEVMRAWATAADQYADPHGDHGLGLTGSGERQQPNPNKLTKPFDSIVFEEPFDFTNILSTLLTEEKHPE